MHTVRSATVWLVPVLIYISVPLSAHAGTIVITEIMYDPAGADSKHEWIEVYADAPTDISSWKVFEGGSNHGLTLFAGSDTVAAGGYAVIADDPATFLGDYPTFSGTLFDVAFTGGLNNASGEAIVLRNDSLVDVDSTVYTPSLGAAGDGNSLQKVGGAWQALAPTPGAAAGAVPVVQDDEEEEETTTPTQQQSSAATTTASVAYNSHSVEPRMLALAGDDRTVVAGASTVYTGNATGLKGDPLSNVRYVWNFGNGDIKEGKSVLYAFRFPGKYAVTLDTSSETWSATDRVVVTAVQADIVVGEVTDEYIEIVNRSTFEIDLGLWQVSAGGKTFAFPPHTIVMAKSSIGVAHAATGLIPNDKAGVTLHYPNGTLVAALQPVLLVPLARAPAAPLAAVTTKVNIDTESADQTPLVAAAVAAEPQTFWYWLGGAVLTAIAGGGAALALGAGGLF